MPCPLKTAHKSIVGRFDFLFDISNVYHNLSNYLSTLTSLLSFHF
jgi:hypothetical protein